MSFRIKNWKLAILALLVFCLFIKLGMWQLHRGQEKKLLVAEFSARTAQTPLTTKNFSLYKDLRFYQAKLTGHFDNQHTLLLDNKTYHGRVGYEVYTLFIANDLSTPVLVDRGFVPLTADRTIMPVIKPIKGTVTIQGLINLPPKHVTLGKSFDKNATSWPLRVQYINLQELSAMFSTTLFPYVLVLKPDHEAAYEVEWQAVVSGPEKHFGYAVQWFAFALVLLVIFVTLNFRK